MPSVKVAAAPLVRATAGRRQHTTRVVALRQPLAAKAEVRRREERRAAPGPGR